MGLQGYMGWGSFICSGYRVRDVYEVVRSGVMVWFSYEVVWNAMDGDRKLVKMGIQEVAYFLQFWRR